MRIKSPLPSEVEEKRWEEWRWADDKRRRRIKGRARVEDGQKCSAAAAARTPGRQRENWVGGGEKERMRGEGEEERSC